MALRQPEQLEVGYKYPGRWRRSKFVGKVQP